MAERLRLKKDNYFTGEKPDIEFVSSGCEILDCILGGGYALGRMTNIIGDKSTAKTALGTEAIVNFLQRYPTGKARYRETEGAFEKNYAKAMGLPIDLVDFADDHPIQTVEAFQRDLEVSVTSAVTNDEPGIYVLDSFDALSDEEELERDIGKGSFNLVKQKKISEMFRRTSKKLESSRVLLIIVSQVRDNIGVSFGEKQRRAGGKALDFYASQFLWLAYTGKVKRTIKGVERVIGISVKANVKKNKIGFPFRTCEFDFIFGYGVDDMSANLYWLKEVKRIDQLDMRPDQIAKFLNDMDTVPNAEFQEQRERIALATRKVWNEIEDTFLPVRKKY